MDLGTLIRFVLGLVLLVFGAEVLVRGAARLASIFGISPLVIGLTVVAFATSAPELAVSLQSAFAGEPQIALGNVIGSNIANILLILGVSAAVAPLAVAQKLVRLDVPLMVLLSVAVWVMSLDRQIGRTDGAILTVGLIVYVVWTLIESRREGSSAEFEEEYDTSASAEKPIKHVVLIAVGLGMLLLGSDWLVDGASAFATYLGMDPMVIGLTIVAIGTSLPELATSVVASMRGQRDIAVGNAIGSNIWNILSVLGLTGLLSPQAIPVLESALNFDMIVMGVVAVACLPIFSIGHRISRWEGLFLLGYYAAYLTYVVLLATEHPARPAFADAMRWFVVPITLVTFLVVFVRYRRAGSSEAA